MGLDLLGLTLRGMGVDPEALMEQAKGLGAAFQSLQSGQLMLMHKLEDIERDQNAIMAAMGLKVTPPTGDDLALIEAESAKLIAAHGGPSRQQRVLDTAADGAA